MVTNIIQAHGVIKMRKKIVAMGIVSVIVLLMANVVSVSGWWDNSWEKRREIMIDNTGGSELSYYQVFVNLTDNPINATSLRVVNENTGTVMPFWIEEIVDGNAIKLWFNASYIPANSWCNDTYYLYYDNPDASSVSNGTATFEFFDDFSGDLSKWNNNYPNDFQIVNGELKITHASTNFALNDFYSISTFDPKTHRIDLKAKEDDGSNGPYLFGWRVDGTTDNVIYTAIDEYHANSEAFKVVSGGSQASVDWDSPASNSWQNYSLWIVGTTGHAKRDSSEKTLTDDKVDDFSSANVGFSRWEDNVYCYIDDIRIRKYADPEPTAELGGEESKPFCTITAIYPEDNGVICDVNTYLMVKVSADDSDVLNITFYNATSGEMLGWNKIKGSGKATCVWKNLEVGGTYKWYVNASDGVNTTQSDTFTFSVSQPSKSSKWDEVYINPEEGLGWGKIENTTNILEMIVKPFIVSMGSWFYAIFILAMVGLIYIKTQNVFLPSLILLLSGLAMVSLMPREIYGVTLAFIALGFTGIIYAAFKRRLE